MQTLSDMLSEYEKDHMFQDPEINVPFWQAAAFERRAAFLELEWTLVSKGWIWRKYHFKGLTRAETQILCNCYH